MFCAYCGKPITADDRFCPNCSQPNRFVPVTVPSDRPAQQPEQQGTTLADPPLPQARRRPNIEVLLATVLTLLAVGTVAVVDISQSHKSLPDGLGYSVGYLSVFAAIGLIVCMWATKKPARRFLVCAMTLAVVALVSTAQYAIETHGDKAAARAYYSLAKERGAKMQMRLDAALRPVQYDQPFSIPTVSNRRRIIQERDKAQSQAQIWEDYRNDYRRYLTESEQSIDRFAFSPNARQAIKAGLLAAENSKDMDELIDKRKALAQETAATLQWLLDHAAFYGIREGRIVFTDSGMLDQYSAATNGIVALNDQVDQLAAAMRAKAGSYLNTIEQQMRE
jgi:hypothetical protein